MRRIAATDPLPRWLVACWGFVLVAACLSAFLLTLNGAGPAALIAPAAVILQTVVVLATRSAQRKKHQVS